MIKKVKRGERYVDIIKTIIAIIITIGLVIFEVAIWNRKYSHIGDLIAAMISGLFVYFYTVFFLYIAVLLPLIDKDEKNVIKISIILASIAVSIQLVYWGIILQKNILFIITAIPAIIVAIVVILIFKNVSKNNP